MLPPGLTLAQDGSLNGIAMEAGSFRFYVEMREPQDDPSNCAGKRTQKEFTLKIRNQPWITSVPAIPESEVGMPFRMTLRARGGSGVFAWQLRTGMLPAGVRLRDDGSIVGTPRIAGTYRFTARATDSEARTLRWPVVLVVASRLVVQTQRLPVGKVDRFYTAKLNAAGGVAPKIWRLRRGRLPRGIHFAPTLGRFTGTPREAGTHVVSVEASDGLDAKSARTFAIVITSSKRIRGSAPQPGTHL